MRCSHRIQNLAAAVLTTAMAACTSAPTHFYTLQQSAAANRPVAALFLIEVLPVVVPTEVDQPELLVRLNEQRVAVLDSERWAAPLAAELRSALAANLAGKLGTRDVHGLPHPQDVPLYRIQVNVRRFDSWPGQRAVIEADWSIRDYAEHILVTCTSSESEQVEPGYDALVQGHQRAIARIADDIATVLRTIAAGAVPACSR
jgi:uncharacterized lipoprotein YmbA